MSNASSSSSSGIDVTPVTEGPPVPPSVPASKSPLPDSFELALNHLEGTLARIMKDADLAIDQVKQLRERAHFDQEKLDRLDKIDKLLR